MSVKSTCEHRVLVGASLLPIDGLSDSDLAAWRELSDSALEPNPFFDPDFVMPAVAELDAP